MTSTFNLFAAGIAGLVLMTAATAHAASPTPLALKMDVMATAVKALAHPGATSIDDVKALKDAATDCRDHSDDLAPAAVAQNPDALKAFKAEFDLLLTKVTALETAVQLPADAANRDAQIKAALADVLAVKKDGHSKFNKD